MNRRVLAKRFAGDRRGAVAIMFALSLLPLGVASGAAIDYSRATQVRMDVQSATDAAALAVGRAAIELGRLDNSVQARQAFDAGFQSKWGATVTRFDVVQTTRKITVNVDASVPLVFASIFGRNNLTVNAQAEVPLDDMTVEVALVLDTTGSMGAAGKMPAMQTASKNLITKLENASVVNTNAFVSIVPFATQVRLPVGLVTSLVPVWAGIRMNHPNDLLEPRLLITFPPLGAGWSGCVADRNKPLDIRGYRTVGTWIDPTNLDSLIPAANCEVAGLQPLVLLNRNFSQLRTAIDALTPAGNTNTHIGLAYGLAVLTPQPAPGIPLLTTGARQPGPLVKKHIILLTDGQNTQNRWNDTTATIDQRTELLCTEVKQSDLNIVIHTILLMEGSPTLLQNCASSPDRYHFVTDPAQLNAVFDAIAAELLSIRLAN